MKSIPLTQGQYALVDDEDYYHLDHNYIWYAHKQGRKWYAKTSFYKNGKWTSESMHRIILGLTPNDKEQVDHIDGNGLNNCRQNLRKCSRTENLRNRKKHSKITTSKFKGVSWDRKHKKWRTSVDKKFGGHFSSEVEAALAYDELAKEKYGEHCQLNFGNTLSQKTEQKTILKDFFDFIALACETYGLKYQEAKQHILKECEKWKINPQTIVWFINWAGPAHMTQQEIADQFDTTQQRVGEELNKLQQRLPDLFNFGARVPGLEEMKSLQQLSNNPEGLTEIEEEILEKF